MEAHKFMKVLQRRMRRILGIKDDTLLVTYYSTADGAVVVMVHAKNAELAAYKRFDSLEAFVWALVSKNEKKEVETA